MKDLIRFISINESVSEKIFSKIRKYLSDSGELSKKQINDIENIINVVYNLLEKECGGVC